MLEDMLLAYVLDLKGSLEEHLPLVKFAYNNSHQASIQMAPYEALYRRPCRSLVCWTEVGERTTTNSKLVRDTSEKVDLIRKSSHVSEPAEELRRHTVASFGV